MRISDWSSYVCSSDLQRRKQLPKSKLPKKAKKAGHPGFIAPALATLKAAPPSGRKWLHEIKFDGYRLQAHVRPHARSGKAKLFTRSGLDWTAKFGKAVVAALAALPVEDAILDGELRSEEHTSELQSLMRNSYAVF